MCQIGRSPDLIGQEIKIVRVAAVLRNCLFAIQVDMEGVGAEMVVV